MGNLLDRPRGNLSEYDRPDRIYGVSYTRLRSGWARRPGQKYLWLPFRPPLFDNPSLGIGQRINGEKDMPPRIDGVLSFWNKRVSSPAAAAVQLRSFFFGLEFFFINFSAGISFLEDFQGRVLGGGLKNLAGPED